jgi:hypothetical protein
MSLRARPDGTVGQVASMAAGVTKLAIAVTEQKWQRSETS